MSEEGFLSRWSRRKAGVPEPTLPVESPAVVAPPAEPAPADAVPPPQPPTLDDVAALDAKASDFTRFVAHDVDPTVKNAALKKLFADPQWNVMDGLDVYIDDYGKPDPVPESVLRKMVQSQFLGLFADEEAATAPQGQNPPPAPDMKPLANEDPDLRLQPDDAARPGSDPPGAREDAGGEH